MIEDLEFIEKVKLYYSFLITEFDYSLVNEVVNGNAFYDVEFRCKDKVISISYENIEDHLEVILFLLQNGEIPDFEDKTKGKMQFRFLVN